MMSNNPTFPLDLCHQVKIPMGLIEANLYSKSGCAIMVGLQR